MRRQRGFLHLPMMAWGAIAAGVVILGLGVALKVQSARLESCQADRVKLEAQARVLGAWIAEQNRAVEALAAEADRKQATSAQALRKAEGRARVWDDNAARLRAILASRKPTDPQDCAEAWETIRSGR